VTTSVEPGSVCLREREVGRVVGPLPGATVIAVGGIHGNEPAGLRAAERVLARLADRGGLARGEVVVLAGNLAALRAGKRYLASDLNRRWSDEILRELRTRGGEEPSRAEIPEDDEQRSLLERIEAARARARGPVFVADLHSSSAAGVPFVLFGDTLAQRRLVRAFPIPVVIGLEEQLDGSLSAYWTRCGCVTYACEGGQHDDPATIDHLAAVLTLTLDAAGVTGEGWRRCSSEARALLRRCRGGLPPYLEVVSRHAISDADGFRMEPGFKNLGHAARGQLLARDAGGEIRAPDDGVVILPLYQGLGSDGFFWGHAMSRARMRADELLRRLHVDRLLPLLPGVTRDGHDPSRLLVREVGLRYPRGLLHTFGYRRVRSRGGVISVERQPDAIC
jgi:succinylglutamate desuccinylase